MVQDKKDYIVEKAFEVFMAKGYDSASMTVLQQELKISRGAMYRYFESKDDLFKAVIDKYVFGMLDSFQPTFTTDNITVLERIELTYSHLKMVGNFLDKIENIEVKFLNFTALAIQAAKKYPGFLDKLRVYKEKNMKGWEKALLTSIENGEVRGNIDVDILTTIFAKSFDIMDDSDKTNKSFLKGIKSAKKTMNYIYSLIKT